MKLPTEALCLMLPLLGIYDVEHSDTIPETAYQHEIRQPKKTIINLLSFAAFRLGAAAADERNEYRDDFKATESISDRCKRR
jgi:hypothetical protein